MAGNGRQALLRPRDWASRTRRPRITRRTDNQTGPATSAGVPLLWRLSAGSPGRATFRPPGCKYPRRLSVYPARATPFDKFNDPRARDGRASHCQSGGPPGPIFLSTVRGFSRGTTPATSYVPKDLCFTVCRGACNRGALVYHSGGEGGDSGGHPEGSPTRCVKGVSPRHP